MMCQMSHRGVTEGEVSLDTAVAVTQGDACQGDALGLCVGGHGSSEVSGDTLKGDTR